MQAHQEKLKGKGISFGKGCIRYSKIERIDFEIVKELLLDAEKSDGEIC